MMMIRFGAVALIAVALAGCATPQQHRAARTTANPSAVVTTELTFARQAREIGQWTAFRRYAADDAIWPDPGWVNAQAAIKGRADPAKVIEWGPDLVWMSCDGGYALSTGPAHYPWGGSGRYITVWQRQGDGSYRFVLDQSVDLAAGYAQPEMIAARLADCPAKPMAAPARSTALGAWASGRSDDGTLEWTTALAADCARVFTTRARQGEAMVEVFRGTAPAPEAEPGKPAPRC